VNSPVTKKYLSWKLLDML